MSMGFAAAVWRFSFGNVALAEPGVEETVRTYLKEHATEAKLSGGPTAWTGGGLVSYRGS
jgi:hypothetical protein